MGDVQVWFFMLGLVPIPFVSMCNMQAVPTYCLNYNKISTEMPIFTSQKQLDLECRDLVPALECCLDAKYAEGCPPIDLFRCQSQWNVISKICKDWQQEMQLSFECFRAIEDSYRSAMSKILTARSLTAMCTNSEDGFYDSLQAAEDAGDSCDGTAKWLMERTLHGYLKPILSLAQCSWEPEFMYNRKLTTTTTTTTTSVTTEALSSIMTTVSQQNTTTNRSYSDLGSGQVFSEQNDSTHGNGASSVSLWQQLTIHLCMMALVSPLYCVNRL